MEDYLCNMYSFLLDRTARRVKQYAQQQFNEKNFNITLDQWLVLRHLYEHNDLNQKELAELLFKDTPTLTRIIDLLCEKGLTERKMHAKDRRSFIVHLTEAGLEMVKELMPPVSEIRLKAWEGLSEKDFQEFKRILNSIYNNLEDSKLGNI
jgi:DNA-binding MarR family transcriptional regulator